ncbi:tRNA lysidine(34) synthetase TilS, partial [Limnohabitans sp. Rim47]
VRKAITEYQLVQDGELILAAVSGGPDSLAMLEILYELKDEFNYQLHVVHLNHKLRKEAKDEAEFVRQFAKSHEIPATILEYDIPALLKEEGGSVQDKAREVRYRLFNRVAEKVGATKIALGHHADDLAETVLMRF